MSNFTRSKIARETTEQYGKVCCGNCNYHEKHCDKMVCGNQESDNYDHTVDSEDWCEDYIRPVRNVDCAWR